jgi:DNA-binding LytR/AlgR family response regulator
MPRSIIRVHVGREQLWLRQEEVRYLQAAGKNTLVFTRGTQGVVRSGLSATASLLNRRDFWQIHRGNVININLVRASYRDDLGRLVLTLSDGPEKFIVSRSHEHLFVRARH